MTGPSSPSRASPTDEREPSRDDDPILRAETIRHDYDTSQGFLDSLLGRGERVRALDGVSLELQEGETLGVVGESGCGKTTLARVLSCLLEPSDGSVYYRGRDLAKLSGRELRSFRTDVQYVFQEPRSSLDPGLTVGEIVREPLDVHGLGTAEERGVRVAELLADVGLHRRLVDRYPHELSGGQCQRVAIARALAVDPSVVVLDEPTSALDVSVQAQLCTLLADLQTSYDLSYVFVSHDLSVVSHVADRVAVLYLGEVVEIGPTTSVFGPPFHPYTEALRSAIPEPDPRWEPDPIELSGDVPSPIDPPSGCRFHTRCPHVIQPDDVDVEQDVWRSLVELVVRLQDAEDLASVLASTGHDGSALRDPTSLSRARLETLVRDTFDLPDRIEHGVEPTVQRAVDRLYDRDLEGARETLESGLETPCRCEGPTQRTVGEDHRIACHLYDDRFASARRRSAPSGADEAGDTV